MCYFIGGVLLVSKCTLRRPQSDVLVLVFLCTSLFAASFKLFFALASKIEFKYLVNYYHKCKQMYSYFNT